MKKESYHWHKKEYREKFFKCAFITIQDPFKLRLGPVLFVNKYSYDNLWETELLIGHINEEIIET